MDISINRLRALSERRLSLGAAMHSAWETVQSARRILAAAKNDLIDYQVHNGLRRDPKGDKPFEEAIKAAEERLAHVEAHHSRAHSDWTVTAQLAARGFDYAKQHVNLPADVVEAFR